MQPTDTDSKRVVRGRWVPAAAGASLLLLGLLVLGGWALGANVLTHLHPILFLAAIVPAGAALLCAPRFAEHLGYRAAVASGASVIAVLGGVGLVHCATGQDLGRFGRIEFHTALSFAWIGGALLLTFSSHRHAPSAQQGLGLLTGLIALIALLERLFMAAAPGGVANGMEMSLPLALGLAAASAGLVFLQPHLGLMRRATQRGISGKQLRRMLPMALIIPPLMALIRIWGETAGLFGPETGNSLYAASQAVVLAVVVWFNARWLEAIEQRRSEAEKEQRRLLDKLRESAATLERTVAERTALLRESEQQFRRIVETASEGIWVLNAQARTTYVNRRMAEMLLCDTDAMLNRPAIGFIFDEDRARAQEDFAQHKKGKLEPFECRLRRADGSELWVSASNNAIVGDDGAFLGVLGMFTDITVRRKAEQALKEADRRKDEFLAVISHELRTPLTPIMGWVGVLRSGKLGPAANARGLEVIERNVKAQGQLVEDLLDVSRIISGKFVLNVRAVDPAAPIHAALESVRAAAQAKSIRIDAQLDAAAGPISADADRMQQAVWNLLTNALKFTGDGGNIRVTLKRIGVIVEIAVSDDGAGIEPAFLPHLFDRFSQEDSGSARAFGGLGIGLALVRHIAELHGGTVRAESGGKGLGARFVMALPGAIVKATPGDARPNYRLIVNRTLAPMLTGVRVLAVDDEPETLEMLTVALGQWGAEVATARSGREALAVMSDSLPDVLISDIGMPEMDGHALIRAIRALSAECGGLTPAVALTAYARAEDRVRALEAGFQMHVPKPVDPSELAVVVANLVGASKSRGSLTAVIARPETAGQLSQPMQGKDV